jgi:hypothetical protein
MNHRKVRKVDLSSFLEEDLKEGGLEDNHRKMLNELAKHGKEDGGN